MVRIKARCKVRSKCVDSGGSAVVTVGCGLEARTLRAFRPCAGWVVAMRLLAALAGGAARSAATPVRGCVLGQALRLGRKAALPQPRFWPCSAKIGGPAVALPAPLVQPDGGGRAPLRRPGASPPATTAPRLATLENVAPSWRLPPPGRALDRGLRPPTSSVLAPLRYAPARGSGLRRRLPRCGALLVVRIDVKCVFAAFQGTRSDAWRAHNQLSISSIMRV